MFIDDGIFQDFPYSEAERDSSVFPFNILLCQKSKSSAQLKYS